MKKAVISGVIGLEGAYLAQLLLNKGYEVCGTSRDAQMSDLIKMMVEATLSTIRSKFTLCK